MLRELKRLGFSIPCRPAGAYYILADARDIHPDSLELSRGLLEDAGVAVTPGVDFGDGAEGHLRFAYTSSLEDIREGLERIHQYLDSLEH